MPVREDLEWLTIDDFRPGIQHRPFNVSVTNLLEKRPGVARENGTYRCRALDTGALAPGPRLANSYTPSALPVDPSLTDTGRICISGNHVAQPIILGGADPIINGEIHVGYEWTESTQVEWRWERHRTWDQPVSIDTLLSRTPTGKTHDGTACRHTWFGAYRAHPSDATQPGQPCVVAGWFPAGGYATGVSESDRVFHAWPDPSSPTSLTPTRISDLFDVEFLVGHQGRIVILDREGFDWGGEGADHTHNEEFYFTDENRLTLASTTGTTFGGENASGYSTLVSSSASELFALKAEDAGAYLIRGDISDPQVQRLPGVPPGSLSNLHHGAVSPLGVAFIVNRGGIWMWGGGGFAEHLSVNLEGDSFLVSDTDQLDYLGSLWFHRDYIFAPNNWMYDWRHESWWRLDNPSDRVLFTFGPGQRRQVFAFPATISSDSDPLCFFYATDDAADDYNWRSQPIPVGIDRDAEIRQLRLVASGTGTVQVRIRDLDGTRSDDTFTVSSNTHPSYFRQNLAITSRDIEIELTVIGTGGNRAPIVNEVSLGAVPGTLAPIAIS